MHPSPFPIKLLLLGLAAACLVSAEPAKKKKPLPLMDAKPKQEAAPQAPPAAFEELSFNRTLVIEGKVEKPQVQFTLLKEPPPEKEIRFETSFMENILKLDRENTFKAGETFGRE